MQGMRRPDRMGANPQRSGDAAEPRRHDALVDVPTGPAVQAAEGEEAMRSAVFFGLSLCLWLAIVAMVRP
jgi:hypothetical protein